MEQTTVLYKLNQNGGGQTIEIIQNWERQKFIYDQKWNISGKKQQNQYPLVFQTLKEIQTGSVELDQNQNPKIIKQIEHIDFKYLKFLWLNKNNIKSLQPLGSMDLPHLRWLWVHDNEIVEFKSLRKLYCPGLDFLVTFNNFANDLSCFTEICGNLTNAYSIQYSADHRKQGQDLKWLLKLETKQLVWLLMSNQKRVSYIKGKSQFAKNIQRRFPAVKFSA